MKVTELLEVNEWENNPETLDYLYKKQLSACHAFMIEVDRVHKLIINRTIHSDYKAILNNILTGWKDLPKWSSHLPKLSFEDYSDLPDLKFAVKYNKVFNAKRAYEQAGGKLERSPWQTSSKEFLK